MGDKDEAPSGRYYAALEADNRRLRFLLLALVDTVQDIWEAHEYGCPYQKEMVDAECTCIISRAREAIR